MQFADYPSQSGKGGFTSLISHLESRKREIVSLPISQLVVGEDGKVDVGGMATMLMTQHAGRTLAGMVKVPPNYIINTPDLNASQNFNFFLPSATGNVKVVFENESIVGVYKEKHTPIPLDIVVEELEAASHGLDLESWNLGEEGLSIRYTSPKFGIEPVVGDITRVGVDFIDYENSSNGIDIRGILHRLVCSNGAIAPEIAYGRYLKKENWKEPAVVMNAAIGYFTDAVDAVAMASANLPLLTEKPFELPEEKQEEFIRRSMHVLRVPAKYDEAVIDYFGQEEATFYGLHNAVTRLGRDAAEASMKFTFERAGFRVLSMLPDLEKAYFQSVQEANA